MLKLWTIIDPRIDQERTYHGTASQSASRRNSERGISQRNRCQPKPPGSSDWRARQSHSRHYQWARNITADTDLRLCKFFGLTEGYFLRLRNAYDTLEAKRQIAREVAKIKRYKSDKAA